MDDKQLNAALLEHRKARGDFRRDPNKPGDGPMLAAQASAAIEALRVEAGRVRDPGGPIGDYGTALYDWARENHPDIDDSEMFHLVFNKLLFDAR